MGYAVDIEPLAPEALVDLQGEPQAVARRAAEWNLLLPATVNRFTVNDGASFAWLGPRHWLLRAPLESESGWNEHIARAAHDPTISAVALGDYYAGLVLRGAEVLDALSQATPLDLRGDALGPGAASFTEFFGVKASIWHGDGGEWQVLVERSYADFILARLQRAAG